MTRSRALLLVVTGLFLSLPLRAADDWASAIGDGSALGLQGQRALVLAGESGASSAEATAALTQALRDRATASLVLDAKTAGDHAGKADPEILAATRKAPVERWVIVRVFDGAPPTAVVTVYDKEGNALHALSLRRGEAAAGSASGNAAQAGASGTAIDSILAVGGAQQAQVDTYLERFLHLGKDIYVSQYSASTYDVVYQGKYQKRLTNKELYTALSDPTIDSRVDEARVSALVSSGIFTGVGTLATIAGIGATWAAFANPANLSFLDDGFASAMVGAGGITVAILGAIFAVGGGMGLIMAPFGDDPGVFTPEELRANIEKHNLRLKKELGLESMDQLPLGI